MARYRVIRNANTGDIVLARAKWCASFWCHLRGLQFTLHLPEDQGLLFVTPRESKSGTAIHMFFMFMSIAVIWVDANGQVVDKKLAKPWRPMYAPSAPAKYYIEARPAVLERVRIGDKLQFDEASA